MSKLTHIIDRFFAHQATGSDGDWTVRLEAPVNGQLALIFVGEVPREIAEKMQQVWADDPDARLNFVGGDPQRVPQEQLDLLAEGWDCKDIVDLQVMPTVDVVLPR